RPRSTSTRVTSSRSRIAARIVSSIASFTALTGGLSSQTVLTASALTRPLYGAPTPRSAVPQVERVGAAGPAQREAPAAGPGPIDERGAGPADDRAADGRPDAPRTVHARRADAKVGERAHQSVRDPEDLVAPLLGRWREQRVAEHDRHDPIL